jgi:hypothetical protein
MEIRLYKDPSTGVPHIYEPGRTEDEVFDVLSGLGVDLPVEWGPRMKIGQTSAGRYLQVIYVPEEHPQKCSLSRPANCKVKPRPPIDEGNGGEGDEQCFANRLG